MSNEINKLLAVVHTIDGQPVPFSIMIYFEEKKH